MPWVPHLQISNTNDFPLALARDTRCKMRDIKLLGGTDSVETETECNPRVAGLDPEAPHFWQHQMKVSNEAQNETRIGSARQHLVLLPFITSVSSSTKEQRLKLKPGNSHFSLMWTGVN